MKKSKPIKIRRTWTRHPAERIIENSPKILDACELCGIYKNNPKNCIYCELNVEQIGNA